jgi:anti-sigma factor RsiW
MDLENTNIINQNIESTLLLRYIKGTTTYLENQQVESWLQEDDARKELVLQIAKIVYAQETQERIKQRDSYAALDNVLRTIKRRSKRRFIRRKFFILLNKNRWTII